MENKNILIISYFFPPNPIVGGKRMGFLSSHLKKYVNSLHILSTPFEATNIDENLTSSGEIHVVKNYFQFPKYNNIKNKILRRLLSLILPVDKFGGWLFTAYWKAIKIIKSKEINKIIVSGPPFSQFLLALLLNKTLKVDYILDYRDPWFIDDPGTNYISRKLNPYLERVALKNSSKVVFNTNLAMMLYEETQMISVDSLDKIKVINNAFENDGFISPKYLNQDKTVLVYAGNLYNERKLHYLFAPLIKLERQGIYDIKNLEIHVFGKIPEVDIQIAKEMDLSGLLYEHSQIPHNEIKEILKGSDILYLPQTKSGKYSIPYKFFDYLMVNKPILALSEKNSATSNIVKELDCGEIASMDNEEEINAALKKILIEKKQYLFRDYREFTWEKVTEKFMKIV